MIPHTEFLNLICETAEENCSLESAISLDELAPEGGLYAELGIGFEDTMYYDKSCVITLPVLFLCKSKDQQNGMEQLCSICNYLKRLKEYPSGESFGWIDTKAAKEPNKIGRDEDGMYSLSCILNCQIYF